MINSPQKKKKNQIVIARGGCKVKLLIFWQANGKFPPFDSSGSAREEYLNFTKNDKLTKTVI